MIADYIKNKDLYTAISRGIKAGLDYIAKTDFSVMETGRYELDGSNLYAMVQKYDSIPKGQGKWECHRRYIDIQYIVDGVEQIGFTNVSDMKVDKKYDQEKDVAFLSGDGDYVTLKKGSYCIFFPEDAHKPKIAPGDKPGPVTKVVVKVKV